MSVIADAFAGTYAGAAQALKDPDRSARCRTRGVAVLYIHGLNPYGFSHLRRTTHENVDLN